MFELCDTNVTIDPDGLVPRLGGGRRTAIVARLDGHGLFDVSFDDGGAGGAFECPYDCYAGAIAPDDFTFYYTPPRNVGPLITITAYFDPHSMGYACSYDSSGGAGRKTFPAAPNARARDCTMTLRLADFVTVGALQLTVGTAGSNVAFYGTGTQLQCRWLASGLGTLFHDDAAEQLSAALIALAGVTGPADVLSCWVTSPTSGDAAALGLDVQVLDASSPAGTPYDPPPNVTVHVDCPPTSATTTTLPQYACGQAAGVSKSGPDAADALFTLKAAVGLTSCSDCVCDVDGSGRITARDALRVLVWAVGNGDPATEAACPPCSAGLRR